MAPKAKEKAADKAAPKAATKAAAAPKVAAAPKIDPSAVPATAEEMADARAGEGKASDRPASRAAVAPLVEGPSEDLVPASNPALRKVVPLFKGDSTKKPKGYHELEVVATRGGYYEDGRKRPGAVFIMGFIGKGYLPTWVKLAKGEDLEAEVSRSRQVSRNSTSQEIIDDVTADAGTEVPTYLGGTQRRPDDFRP